MASTRFMLIILGIQNILANNDNLMLVTEQRQFQTCGTNLASLLRMVCKEEYNDGMLSKKSSSGEMNWQRELEPHSDIDDSINDLVYQFPFRSRTQAQQFLTPEGVFRRHTRGVVEECCHKPCSIYELTSYCAGKK